MYDYNNALIYKITVTDDYIYVGSSCDFDGRKINHKAIIYNEDDAKYNLKLYTAIRENDGQFNIETDMEILHYFPCKNKRELAEEEQRVINELNPKLNMCKAYLSFEEKRAYKKRWKKENKELVIASDRRCKLRNKEKIKERYSKRVKCPYCSKEMANGSLSRHKKKWCKSIARNEVPSVEQVQADHAKQK